MGQANYGKLQPSLENRREGIAFIGQMKKLGGGFYGFLLAKCGSFPLVGLLLGKEIFFLPPARVCKVRFFLLEDARSASCGGW